MTVDFLQSSQHNNTSSRMPAYAPASHDCLSVMLMTAEAMAEKTLLTKGAVPLQYTEPQPWKTPLAQFLDRHVNYTASISVTEVPARWHMGLEAYSRRHEGRCFDAGADGFYLVPDWYLFLSDQTLESEVMELRQREALAGYSHVAWQRTGLTDLVHYFDVLQALRFLACIVPQGTLGKYRLAIFMPPQARLPS